MISQSFVIVLSMKLELDFKIRDRSHITLKFKASHVRPPPASATALTDKIKCWFGKRLKTY